MKKFMAIAAALLLAAGLASTGLADETLQWLTSYDKAVAQAKKESKFVLADFTGSDWCIWCKRLHSEVFDTKEFKDWAAKKAVLLQLDFPKNKQLDDATKKQNKELAKKFEIKGYPTIIFLDGEGKKIGETGYVKGGPDAWIKKAEEVLAKK